MDGLSGPKRRKLLLTVAAAIATAFVLGAMFGKYESPDYSDSVQTLQYFWSNAIIIPSSEDVAINLAAGPWQYQYRLTKDKVERAPLDPYYVALLKPNRRSHSFEARRFFELVGIFSPAGLAASFIETETLTARLSKATRFGWFAKIVLAATGSGLLGYWLTYDDRLDYDNPKFVQILSDTRFWRKIANKTSICFNKLLADDDKSCSKFRQWVRYHCQLEVAHIDAGVGDLRQLPACKQSL